MIYKSYADLERENAELRELLENERALSAALTADREQRLSELRTLKAKVDETLKLLGSYRQEESANKTESDMVALADATLEFVRDSHIRVFWD